MKPITEQAKEWIRKQTDQLLPEYKMFSTVDFMTAFAEHCIDKHKESLKESPEENGIYQPIDILDTSNPPKIIEKLKLKEPEEIKTVNCYIAMNKDEYNIENMSFSQNKNKLIRRWGDFQDIIEAKIIFKNIIN